MSIHHLCLCPTLYCLHITYRTKFKFFGMVPREGQGLPLYSVTLPQQPLPHTYQVSHSWPLHVWEAGSAGHSPLPGCQAALLCTDPFPPERAHQFCAAHMLPNHLNPNYQSKWQCTFLESRNGIPGPSHYSRCPISSGNNVNFKDAVSLGFSQGLVRELGAGHTIKALGGHPESI